MADVAAAVAAGPTDSRRALLGGGWWPCSVDPAAELPGLVLAIDSLCGPITWLVLNAAGWESHLRLTARREATEPHNP